MKIKKTVTDKVIAANQDNGRKGKGPNNVGAVAQNARKHGLLSKYLVFETEEERQEFHALLDELAADYQPADRTAVELVEEVAINFWSLAKGNGLETQELAHRRKATAAILTTLAENYVGEQLPLFTQAGRFAFCRAVRMGLSGVGCSNRHEKLTTGRRGELER